MLACPARDTQDLERSFDCVLEVVTVSEARDLGRQLTR